MCNRLARSRELISLIYDVKNGVNEGANAMDDPRDRSSQVGNSLESFPYGPNGLQLRRHFISGVQRVRRQTV